MFHDVFCIIQSVVYYSDVSFSRLTTSVGEEGAAFFCYRLLIIFLFVFEGVSSSSVYL